MAVYVFLANGFEETEAFTTIDYLRRCEELEVISVGVGGKMVTGSHKITTITDITIFDIEREKLDMVVLPGGMPGTLNLEKSMELQQLLIYCVTNMIKIAAICAAPSILGHMGLLKGKNVTCYDGFDDELIGATIVDAPVVIDGNIITSRGAGTANQFAFALVEVLLGVGRANKLKGSVKWTE